MPLEEAPVVETSDVVTVVSSGCPDELGFAPVLLGDSDVEPPEVAGVSEVEPLPSDGEPSSPHALNATATPTPAIINLSMQR